MSSNRRLSRPAKVRKQNMTSHRKAWRALLVRCRAANKARLLEVMADFGMISTFELKNGHLFYFELKYGTLTRYEIKIWPQF